MNKKEATKLIGSEIRKQRIAVGVTVTHLAKSINVHRNTIANYELGKTDVSSSNLYKLAQVLGCSIEVLLGIRNGPPMPKFLSWENQIKDGA